MAQSLSDIFTTGIGAVRDVLVARESNDPTPNNRGSNDVTAPVGSPAGIAAALSSSGAGTLLAVAAVGVLVYLLVRR